MQQKINANALRLGKRINWLSTWGEYPKTFIKSLFFDLELRFFVKLLLDRFGFFDDNLRVKKNARVSRSSGRALSSVNLIGKWYSYLQNIPESSKLTKELRDYKQNQYVNCLLYFFGYHVFEYRLYFAKEADKAWFHPEKRTCLPIFSGQLISNYISKQISLSMNFKDLSFKNSFETALKKIARNFAKTQNCRLVSGIKIICSGKWKKTKSGRAQSAVFRLGRLRTQSVSSLVDCGFATSVTKFGCCGVKVWVSYKSLKFPSS